MAGSTSIVRVEGLSATQAALAAIPKQIAFANVVAINRAAFAGRAAIQRAMPTVFDRPTPWVIGGVRVIKARKDKPSAQIDLDNWGNKQGVAVESILQAEIYGGGRRLKRHELALQRIGILPDGMQCVPGAGAVIDNYGNMSSGQINQILAYFRAFGEQGYRANMTTRGIAKLAKGNRTKRGFDYFVVAPGKQRAWLRGNGIVGTHKMQPGIYQRTDFGGLGSAIKPVLIFVKQATYRPRFDFHGIAKRAAVAEFDVQFPIVLEQAMRTAR